MGKDTSFGQVMYANIQENKGARLRDYRVMAAYSDVVDALDEICDEAINTDDTGSEIHIQYVNDDLSGSEKAEIDEEFSKFVNYFDFKYVKGILTFFELFYISILKVGCFMLYF